MNALQTLHDNVKILGVHIRFIEALDGSVPWYDWEGKKYTPPEFIIQTVVPSDMIKDGIRECYQQLENTARNLVRDYGKDTVIISYRNLGLACAPIDTNEFTPPEYTLKPHTLVYGMFSVSAHKRSEETTIIATSPTTMQPIVNRVPVRN